MIISFAYTTPALLAGAKTVTRRDWSPHHADFFIAAVTRGKPVDAYDKSQRLRGRKVAEIRLLSVALAPIADMPDSDYEAEGFRWLHEHYSVPPKSAPFRDFSKGAWEAWRASGAVLYVVRFELVRLTQAGEDQITTLEALESGAYL